MFLCRKKRRGLCDDLTVTSENQKQQGLHKAKSKAGYSQNAFHRGQYANFSSAANGSLRVVVQIQEELDQVTWQRHEEYV